MIKKNKENDQTIIPQNALNYGNDILGNTEVDVDINSRVNPSPRQPNGVNPNINDTEYNNLSNNSPRPNQDTNMSQNVVTSIVNVNHASYITRPNLGTENIDSYYNDPLNERYNANILNEQQSTERENDLVSSNLIQQPSVNNLFENQLE